MNRFLLILASLIAYAATLSAQTAQPLLADLIQNGDLKTARARIAAGADVNGLQPDGTSPLHWAVYRVDHDLLASLLNAGAKADVTNNFGSTPLSEAVQLIDVDAARMLLEAGADPESPNDDGQTALMLAVETGNTEMVRVLLDAGADANVVEQFHQQTPLMWAAANPDGAEIVRMLLAAGAEVTPRAEFSDWPSQISSEPRAQYRATGGLTALLYAARSGCTGCVDALLDAGADANRPTPEAVTALMLALDNGHNDTALRLLERGADPNVWDWWGRTALYIAVDRNNGGRGSRRTTGGRGGQAVPSPGPSNVEVIRTLLDAGVDPDPQLNMHRPSWSGSSGRFVDPWLNTGCTPLLRATLAEDPEVMRLLLEHGANPNIDAMGLTPFLVAAGVGTGGQGTGLASETSIGMEPNQELTDLLLEFGAGINAQVTGTLTYSKRVGRSPSITEGHTALHAAVQRGDVAMVRYLLDKGIDTGILDAEGRLAIHMLDSTQDISPPWRDGPVSDETKAEIRSLIESAN